MSRSIYCFCPIIYDVSVMFYSYDYTQSVWELISVASYWRSPRHLCLWRKKTCHLSLLFLFFIPLFLLLLLSFSNPIMYLSLFQIFGPSGGCCSCRSRSAHSIYLSTSQGKNIDNGRVWCDDVCAGAMTNFKVWDHVLYMRKLSMLSALSINVWVFLYPLLWGKVY
jgi:hypothetical protein